MAIIKVTDESVLESAIYGAAVGDVVEVAFTPPVGFRLDLDGKKCKGVTLDLGGRKYDGGLGWLIDAAYAENLNAPIWEHKQDFVIRVRDPYEFKLQNGEIFNTGRCVHLTGDADDKSQSVYTHNLKLYRFIERGLGGPVNNQHHDLIHMSQGVLMNYNGLMLKKFGKEQGWSLAAGPYKEWGTNKSVSNCTIRNSYFEYCWGETLATFHCDRVVWENIVMYNASSTCFMYAEQGKDVVIRNVLCVADSKTPKREGRGPHGLLIASEANPRWPMNITVENLIVYGTGFEAAVRGWQAVDVGVKLAVTNSTLDAGTVFDFDSFGDANIYVDNCILRGQMKLNAKEHFEWGDNYDGFVQYTAAGVVGLDGYKLIGPDEALGYGYQFDDDFEPPVDVPPVDDGGYEERIAFLEALVQEKSEELAAAQGRIDVLEKRWQAALNAK